MSHATIQGYEYRRWDRQLRHARWVWPAIVVNEIKLAMREAKTRNLVLTSGFLVVGACGVFYIISLLEGFLDDETAQGLFEFVRSVLSIDLRGLKVADFRDALWRSVFFLMIKVQLIWVLIVVARVGAGLISRDLKARALPIYFSKPLTPATYLLGKWGAVATFISLVMLIPNLLALAVGTAITGGPGSWSQVMSMALGLALSGLMVCIVAGALILAISSMSADQRYVTVGFVAVCLLSVMAQQVVDDALPADAGNMWLRAISLRDNVVVVSEQFLGVRRALEGSSLPEDQLSAALSRPMEVSHPVVLAGLTAVCLVVCWRRVVRFSRSAATLR